MKSRRLRHRVLDGGPLVRRQFGLQRLEVVGEGRLDQDHAGDVARMGRRIERGDRAAERVADEDERLSDPGRGDQTGEVVGQVTHVGGPGPGVAEAEPGAIVGADPGEPGDVRLHEAPGDHAVAGPRLEDDGGFARADAIEVDAAGAVDRHELLRLRVDAVGDGLGRGGRAERDGAGGGDKRFREHGATFPAGMDFYRRRTAL